MKNNNTLLSSKQSLYCVDGLKKYSKNIYSNMLIDDLTVPFSIFLLPKDERDDFYQIEPKNDPLKGYLSAKAYRLDDYDFDQLLSVVSMHLIVNGKAFVEIITLKNTEEKVVGLSFEPVCVKRGIAFYKKYYFRGTNIARKTEPFQVDAKRIICFDLREMGMKRCYFRKLFHRLAKIDMINSTALSLDQKLNGKYNFDDHHKRHDFLLLKYTHNLYWYGRNSSNQFMSESYLLYRSAHQKLWRKQFLDYLIKKLNEGLSRYKEELCFEGNIVVKELGYNYYAELVKYDSGELNAEQLAKKIYN